MTILNMVSTLTFKNIDIVSIIVHMYYLSDSIMAAVLLHLVVFLHWLFLDHCQFILEHCQFVLVFFYENIPTN